MMNENWKDVEVAESNWDSIQRLDDYETLEASMKQIQESYEESKEQY